jgi:hypothetical protein
MRIMPVAVFQTSRNQQDLRYSNGATSFSVTQLEAELNFTHANANEMFFEYTREKLEEISRFDLILLILKMVICNGG